MDKNNGTNINENGSIINSNNEVPVDEVHVDEISGNGNFIEDYGQPYDENEWHINPDERPPPRHYISDQQERQRVQTEDIHTMLRRNGLVQVSTTGPVSIGEVVLRVEEALDMLKKVEMSEQQVKALKTSFRESLLKAKPDLSKDLLRQRVSRARKERLR